MVLRRLLHAFHRRDFGEHHRQQACFVEELEAAPRRAFGQQLGEFIAQALGGNLSDFGSVPLDRRKRGWLDGETETRGKAHRAH